MWASVIHYFMSVLCANLMAGETEEHISDTMESKAHREC